MSPELKSVLVRSLIFASVSTIAEASRFRSTGVAMRSPCALIGDDYQTEPFRLLTSANRSSGFSSASSSS